MKRIIVLLTFIFAFISFAQDMEIVWQREHTSNLIIMNDDGCHVMFDVTLIQPENPRIAEFVFSEYNANFDLVSRCTTYVEDALLLGYRTAGIYHGIYDDYKTVYVGNIMGCDTVANEDRHQYSVALAFFDNDWQFCNLRVYEEDNDPDLTLNTPINDSKRLDNGHFVLVGYQWETYRVADGLDYGYMAYCDQDGEMLWSRTYTRYQHSYELNQVYPVEDGFLCIVEYSWMPMERLWGVEFALMDSSGQIMDFNIENYHVWDEERQRYLDINFGLLGSIIGDLDDKKILLYGTYESGHDYPFPVAIMRNFDDGTLWRREYHLIQEHQEDDLCYFADMVKIDNNHFLGYGRTFIDEQNLFISHWLLLINSERDSLSYFSWDCNQRYSSRSGEIYYLGGGDVLVETTDDLLTLIHINGLDIVEDRSVPVGFDLQCAYPNPFNSTTCLKYSLPAPAGVYFALYDAQGSEVEVIAGGRQNAGSYSYTFNAEGLASGVYFVKLTAGAFTASEKITLIK